MWKWILLMSAGVLSSCLEYQDELLLKESGQGTFRFQVAIPADLDIDPAGHDNTEDFFQADSLRSRIQAVQGLVLDSLRVYERDGKNRMDAYLRFDSLQALARVGGMNPDENFIGELSLRSEGDFRILERTLTPTGGAHGPENQVNALAVDMMGTLLDEFQWQYALQVPGRIVEANTRPEWIDSGSGEVRWVFSMAEITRNPLKMHVRYQIRSPESGRPSLLPLILSVGLLVGALYMLNRRMRALQQILARRKDEKDFPQ